MPSLCERGEWRDKQSQTILCSMGRGQNAEVKVLSGLDVANGPAVALGAEHLALQCLAAVEWHM